VDAGGRDEVAGHPGRSASTGGSTARQAPLPLSTGMLRAFPPNTPRPS
jgi:hypothetical protein